MKNSEFKQFKEFATANGLNATSHMGYSWIYLTDKQVNQICYLADLQGFKRNERGWYELNNGIQFRRV